MAGGARRRKLAEPFTSGEVERYARQLVLREIGGAGQQRLKAARVLIVGVGGLGGPAALSLAAAGVGTLHLVDHDDVALSNLQRQVLFDTEDLGRPKVAAAAPRLAALNPHVAVRTYAGRLVGANADALVGGCHVVLDGTDDFETRAVVNAACVAAGVPLVSGAVGRWTGQVGVFVGRPCWACLTPAPPPDAESCASVGVLGALTATVGSMMAAEAVKLVTGAGQPLLGRLLLYDALTGTARTVAVLADPSCRVCGASTGRGDAD